MPPVLDLEVQPLLPADAEVISHWRYSGPYVFYDGPIGRESESARYMLDSRNRFYAVRRASTLVGFCSFGFDGRVAGVKYDDDALDIGAGMNPGLVGNGDGRAFLRAVVQHATRNLKALRLRATVASWNERALRASRSVGFNPVSTFRTQLGIEFTVLVRDSAPDENDGSSGAG